jgi:hypothetical protein
MEQFISQLSVSFPNNNKSTIQFDGAHLELVSEENNEKLMTFLKDHVTPDEILGKSIGFISLRSYET